MPIDQVARRSGIYAIISTESKENSVIDETEVFFRFYIKEKRQWVVPSAEGIRIIYQREHPTIQKDFRVQFVDLVFYDRIESCVLSMLSSINLLNRDACESLKLEISAFTSDFDIEEVVLQTKAAAIQIVVEIDVSTTELYEDGEAVDRGVRESMEFDEQMEFRIIPASRASIEALERKKFSRGESVEVCMICLYDFSNGVDVTRMPCSHIYHTGCIVQWLELGNTCPLCRFEMPTDLIVLETYN